MKIDTVNGEFEFYLPERIKVLAIKVSGGLDSAILLYMTCKFIQENDRDITVNVITTNDWLKPYQVKFATQVLDWMKNEFPNIKWGQHNTHQLEHGQDYIKGQTQHKEKALTQMYLDGLTTDVVLYGQNLAPPPEVMKTFIALSDNHLLRGPDSKDNRNIVLDAWPTQNAYRPLVMLDKQGVADLYKHFGLMDTLFNETRSCECSNADLTNNFTTHCETECWWCYERGWGFGKIKTTKE